MKRLFTLLLLISSISVNAQEKIKEVVSDVYNRSSMSVILSVHNDNNDRTISNAFLSIDKGDKFDWNKIATSEINSPYPRTVSASLAQREQDVAKTIAAKEVGKQILGYWHGRADDGTMNIERIKQRGFYNAKDQDYLNAQIQKLGVEALGDVGFSLIANSYVLVVDYTNVETKKLKSSTQISANAEGYLYKIVYDDNVKNNFYTNMWVENTSDPKFKEKVAAFNNLKVSLQLVTAVEKSCSASEDDGGLAAVVAEGYDAIIYALEKKVEDFKVKVSINQVKPIRAKIGKKENVKNGQRFIAYKFREDAETGNLEPVKMGTLRATTVADNRVASTGNSKLSEFYQIAGRGVEEGFTLKQKNDLKMNVGFAYRIGGKSGANVQIDYLTRISTKGTSQYAIVDISANTYKIASEYASLLNFKTINAISVGVGYGFGLRLSRLFELVPNFVVGGEYLATEDELAESESDDSFSKKLGYYVMPALRFKANLAYPIQLFAEASYAITVSEGELYKDFNSIGLKECIKGGKDKRRQGFGISAGFRVNF